jgi:hypothetical protein
VTVASRSGCSEFLAPAVGSLAVDGLDAVQIHLGGAGHPYAPADQLRHDMEHDLIDQPGGQRLLGDGWPMSVSAGGWLLVRLAGGPCAARRGTGRRDASGVRFGVEGLRQGGPDLPGVLVGEDFGPVVGQGVHGLLGNADRTDIREDQILPHLAAPAILLSGDDQALPDGTMQVTAPGQAAGLIDQLRTAGITFTYDPDTRTIRTSDSVAVTVGQDR